jgi:hypothetical protein
LANDVIQHSRKKGGEYVETFLKIVPETVISTYRSGNETIRGSVKRLLQIWYDRKVFSAELLDSIKNQLALEIRPLEVYDEETPEPSSLSKLMTAVEGSTEEVDQIEYHMKTVTDPLLSHFLRLDIGQRQDFIDTIRTESNLLCDHENKLKSRQEQHVLFCQYLFEEYKKHQEQLERDIHLLQVSPPWQGIHPSSHRRVSVFFFVLGSFNPNFFLIPLPFGYIVLIDDDVALSRIS